MTLLSDAINRIQPSPTVSITAHANELAAEGHPIISLSAGEPDFDTPQHIKEAAARAIAEGRTRYTAPQGIIELREAVAAKTKRDTTCNYAPENVIVTSGGKQVIFNAMLATLNPEDEVIIPAPYWVSYPDIVRLTGARARIVATKPDDGYKLSAAALAAAITPQTKWLILNSPGNPSGAGYSAEDLADLAEILRAHPQVWVMSDDIYEYISFPPYKFCTLAAIAPDLADRCLIVNGVSKAYAMTGWRIGFGIGPAPLIRAMVKIQGQSTTTPCSISQWAALAALTGPQDYLEVARAAFQRRRDFMVTELNACPGLTCLRPDGAFYVFPSIDDLIGSKTPAGVVIENDEIFAKQLLVQQNLALVFGAAFGTSPNIRISYAASDEILREACNRLRTFSETLSK